MTGPTDRTHCGNCGESGPWQPLYIVAAPDGDRTPERRGQTPSKGEIHVVAVLDESGNPRLVVQWPPDSADPRDTYQQKLLDERDEARAEVERLKADVKLFTDVFGEKPGTLALRLPEVPEGTVALVGERTRGRYVTRDGGWMRMPGSSWFENVGHVLAYEHPEGVRVELAKASDAPLD